MSRPWQIFENVARSRELCFRYLPLLEMMYSLTSPAPVKMAMGRWDLPAGRLRRPLPDIALEKAQQLETLLAELGVWEEYGVVR